MIERLCEVGGEVALMMSRCLDWDEGICARVDAKPMLVRVKDSQKVSALCRQD